MIQEALQKNPEILAARARWEAEDARFGQANSLDDPELGFDTEQEKAKEEFDEA